MAAPIRVLQVGRVDFSESYPIPAGVSYRYLPIKDLDILKRQGQKPFDAILMEQVPDGEDAVLLSGLAPCYTFFYTEGALFEGQKMPDCLKQRMVRRIRQENVEGFLSNLARYFHGDRLGTKLPVDDICLGAFAGRIGYDGNRALVLRGEYGRSFTPLLSWRTNMFCAAGRALELWLEYDHSQDIEVLLVVRLHGMGGGAALKTWTFSEKDMIRPLRVEVPYGEPGACFSASLMARGGGRLSLGPLHYRSSRYGAGTFLPGGKTVASKGRQEILSYFDPGDAKPPLNVYFSGYRTAEGFEGLGIMQQLGAPFLLLADPRLEGGSFYLGSQNLESTVEQEIRNALDILGFTSEQLVLSGLSMGTFGAVYYGCRLRPYAIIAGKPLLNLGTVAANETLVRPGGFATSLDVLRSLTGGISAEHVRALNERLWEAVDAADFSQTEFVVAYMESDDYDQSAYQDLLTHLSDTGARIVGKGIGGRHNDNTGLVVEWFLSQYKRVMREGFDRVQMIRR